MNTVPDMPGHWTRTFCGTHGYTGRVVGEKIRYGVPMGTGPHVIVQSVSEHGGWSPISRNDYLADGFREVAPAYCRSATGEVVTVARFDKGDRWEGVAVVPDPTDRTLVYFKGTIDLPWDEVTLVREPLGEVPKTDFDGLRTLMEGRFLSRVGLVNTKASVSERLLEEILDRWLLGHTREHPYWVGFAVTGLQVDDSGAPVHVVGSAREWIENAPHPVIDCEFELVIEDGTPRMLQFDFGTE